MPQIYYQATGRRKSATARVRLYPGGTGKIVVNGKEVENYFVRASDVTNLKQPMAATATAEKFDVSVVVVGGGVSGQSGAVRHGIARALVESDPDLRPTLRKDGFLTRDPRAKERKKPGLKRARKAPQYTKR
jgi:small subunit ribosomal protein S9